MRDTKNKKAGSLNGVIQLGLMSVALAQLTLSAAAQQVGPATKAPQKPPAAVPYVEATPSSPQKPGSEGIKISGHWVMDVVNRDGTIAEHRDFENALAPSGGGAVLAGLLIGTLAPQTFDIVLAGTGKTALLYISGQNCPQGFANYSGDCSATLTQALGPGGSSIVLKSMYTPAAPLTITTVSTNIGTCPSTDAVNPVSAATCFATTSGPIPGAHGAYVGTYNFTAATIPDLAIAADQVLVVKVTISFS